MQRNSKQCCIVSSCVVYAIFLISEQFFCSEIFTFRAELRWWHWLTKACCFRPDVCKCLRLYQSCCDQAMPEYLSNALPERIEVKHSYAAFTRTSQTEENRRKPSGKPPSAGGLREWAGKNYDSRSTDRETRSWKTKLTDRTRMKNPPRKGKTFARWILPSIKRTHTHIKSDYMKSEHSCRI